jgi:protein-L-isoaspartate(D-aspartate) O-methyltransferase
MNEHVVSEGREAIQMPFAVNSLDKAATDEGIAHLIDIVDKQFKLDSQGCDLPPAIKDAISSTPRHKFVHRFRLPMDDSNTLYDFDSEPLRCLPLVYSDQAMVHVDANGASLPSTNSQPTYVLRLLDMLGLQPAQSVLEVGSGSGWLLALMRRLVGDRGSVSGVEIIDELVKQSRCDLHSFGMDDVSVVAGDGTREQFGDRKFDRIMITAATWDLPAVLFNQIAENGRIVLPVALRGGGGCLTTLFCRDADRLIAKGSLHGWFVPLLGGGQSQEHGGTALEALRFWHKICGESPARWRLWLGGPHQHGLAPAAAAFRDFLRVTEVGFAVFDKDLPEAQRFIAAPFGLIDMATEAVAFCWADELVSYGVATAAKRLIHAYLRWTSYGMPGQRAFALQITPAASAPCSDEHTWIERRGESALVWKLDPEAERWRSLA